MDSSKLSVIEHLENLRGILIKGSIAILIATVISFIFGKYFFSILVQPASGFNLVFIEVPEMFNTYVRVALVGGIILAMPYLTYLLFSFIFPALTVNERKYLYKVVPWTFPMFIGGVAFGYFLLIPFIVKFLVTFGSGIAIPMIRVSNYISVVLVLLLVTGIIFETPLIVASLTKLGVVSSKWLSQKRKYAYVAVFVAGAIVTPPDIFSQVAIAVPLLVLYEVGIVLAKVVEPKLSLEVSYGEANS